MMRAIWKKKTQRGRRELDKEGLFSLLPKEEGIAQCKPLPGNEISNEIMITSFVRRMRNP